MQIETKAEIQEVYTHFSKDKSYIGTEVSLSNRPNELPLHPKRFKKSEKDKLDCATMKMLWENKMKSKLGENWKEISKKNHIYN